MNEIREQFIDRKLIELKDTLEKQHRIIEDLQVKLKTLDVTLKRLKDYIYD